MTNNQQHTSAAKYSVVETIALSSRSILRRARSADGSMVILESFKDGGAGAEQRKELELELQMLAELASPGVLLGHEIADVDGQPALVLEDFGGGTISIPEGGLDVGLCLDIAIQVAKVLGNLHARGLVHNNVQPGNFLMHLETRQLKVIDFFQTRGGVASDVSDSLAYIAPERTGRVNRRPDHRADYYSLGVTLFQLLTGKLPFAATDALGWAHAHSSKQAPTASELVPTVPRPLSQFVAKLLAKNPEARYQSSHGLLADLTTFSESWARAGELKDFALGAYDVSRELEVSTDLVGRKAELDTLLAMVDQVRSGATRLGLLSGSPGVGKSALLAEFAREAAPRTSFFLSSTFDKQALNVPYSGLTQALQGLVRELLSRPEEELIDVKRQILAALGSNAGVMSDLVPDLSVVIGTQPVVAQLNPIEAHRRLQRVLSAFIGVFVRPEQPMVFALDDCQWMDMSTAETLSALLTDPDLRCLLVLAAFRENEISEAHPLAKLREVVRTRATDNLVSLHLEPLDSSAVAEILAHTLRTSRTGVSELAELVHRKTDGNPFFIGEFLGLLHRQDIVTLDLEHARWQPDLERVRSCQVSDNVGTLMAERLDRVSPAAAELLAAAACFGNRFELAVLAEVTQLQPLACSELLSEAIVERLLLPAGSDSPTPQHGATESPLESGARTYAFQHPRVQQAAAARLSETRRVTLHGRIGDLMKRGGMDDAGRTRIYEVLRHLNLARATLTRSSARLELAELNLKATTQALRSAASDIAEAHAEIAVELMGSAERALAPDLAFRVYLARAEAVFSVGKGIEAEGLCTELGELAPDKLSRARVCVLKTRILEHQGRLSDAIAQIRAAVAEFGVRLPESPEEVGQGIGAGIAKMQAHLARVPVEALADLPEADSAETKMVLSLLEQVIPPAIQTFPPLFILAELIMFDLALTHGVSAASCKNFVDCGIIQAGILSNHDLAYRLAQAAFSLLKRYAPTPSEAGVNFVFAAFVSHWRAPLEEGFAAYDQAEKRGLELGDLQHVAYALAHRTQRSFLTGKHLTECDKEAALAQAYLRRISAHGQSVGTLVSQRAVARLMAGRSETEAVAQADAEAAARVIASKNNQWAYSYGQAQVMTSFILGDLASAQRWQAFTKPYSLSAASLFSVADYHLFEALLAVAAYRDAAPEDRDGLLKTIDQNLQKLHVWAQACPQNFAHKHHLLTAERALALAEPLQTVLAGYRDAVTTAGDGFPQMRALACEREALLWHSLGDARHARTCIEAAYRLYEGWGATAKLELLEQKYPAWLADAFRSDVVSANASAAHTAGNQRGGLDAASILKATQSISVEVQAQKLFSALMATLIESAGAQQGCLILQDEGAGQYYVEARANVDVLGPNPAQREEFGSADALCASVVRYVLRSREAVVLDDAAVLGAFQGDPYIKRQRVRSVLCAPILRQGAVMGVLYLENNLTSHAFTRERLALLQVIASQAAISIYNAQLYESLERRVAERTDELAFKNRQIASMLDNLDQGVFTIDETLRVQPEYSRYLEQILGTADILGKNCVELLFAGAALRADAVNACSTALRFSFGVEPWLAEGNAWHLITEMQKAGPDGRPRFFDISWNLISNEAGLVERVLVAVRDVTLLRHLKQAATEKEREIDIIAQVLESGIDALTDFGALSRRLLAENRAALAPDAVISAQSVAAAFRNLHTLKGNARLHGFTHLVDGLHVAEEAYDVLRKEPTAPVDASELLAHLDAAGALVSQYEDVCQLKLATLRKDRDGRAERALQEISTLLADTDSANSDITCRIREIVAGLQGTTITRLIEETQPIVPSLAAELGKATPLVQTQHTEIRLTRDWSDVVKHALIQSFRNALYHGLETPEARRQSGKVPKGRIEIRTQPCSGGLELLISDDGRGLALGILRRRVADCAVTDNALAQQIFESGLTTAAQADHVAGRGVGLDLVRCTLREHGGDALVRFTGEENDGYRPFVMVLVLPANAVLNGIQGEQSSRTPHAAE